MRLLLTRPREDATALTECLHAKGHEVLRASRNGDVKVMALADVVRAP